MTAGLVRGDGVFPPAARTSASVRASSGSRTSTIATAAPARANSSALARPIPVAAPVMMATLPRSAPLSARLMARSILAPANRCGGPSTPEAPPAQETRR